MAKLEAKDSEPERNAFKAFSPKDKTMYPEGKKEVRNDAVGWVDQPVVSLKLQPNLKEGRATVFISQMFSKPEMRL